MKRSKLIRRAAAAAALLCAIGAPIAWAHGQVDQANDPQFATGWYCAAEGPDQLYAGFTPTRRQLSSFAVRLVKGFSFPPSGLTLTGRVHAGNGTGAVLGSATAVVPYPGEARPLVFFDFTPPVVLEPQGMFVFELASDVSGLRWLGTEVNPYPNGHSFDCGGVDPLPSHDFNFISYAPPDGGPPRISISSNRRAWVVRERTVELTFSAVDDLSYPANLVLACKLDGEPHTPCTSPVSLRGLEDGEHSFSVEARDQLGQRDSSDFSWTVDGTAPGRPRVVGPRRPSNARATYRFSARDEIDENSQLKFRCAIDSRRLRPCGRRITRRVSKGRHLLRVVAIDRAGNVSRPAVIKIARA